jgi:hypothetical protein
MRCCDSLKVGFPHDGASRLVYLFHTQIRTSLLCHRQFSQLHLVALTGRLTTTAFLRHRHRWRVSGLTMLHRFQRWNELQILDSILPQEDACSRKGFAPHLPLLEFADAIVLSGYNRRKRHPKVVLVGCEIRWLEHELWSVDLGKPAARGVVPTCREIISQDLPRLFRQVFEHL